jgi:acetyl esterase/lipase
VPVELDVWPDMNHAFHLFEMAPEAHAATARIAGFVATHAG